MPVPQAVVGRLLDIKRSLAFRRDVSVNVLILYDETGAELTRITKFWYMGKPKTHFGDNSESSALRIVEDATPLATALAATQTFKYIVTKGGVDTLSGPYTHQGVPAPPPGRNAVWNVRVYAETFNNRFFRPPGQ